MPKQNTIWKQFRVVFTAATLLCALFLNYQEITTFAGPAAQPAENARSVDTSKNQPDFTIKQKISFEAVTSFILLPAPEPALTSDLTFTFIPAITGSVQPVLAAGLPFLSLLLGTAIQPNAP
jgi:hypothetical protein